jgi:uncharacterized membrane protein
MNRRMWTWVGITVLTVLTIGPVAGCAHQRESFTWPWAKKGNTALAEPPLDQAAREGPRSASAGSRSASSRRGAEAHEARAHDGDAFDFGAFRE